MKFKMYIQTAILVNKLLQNDLTSTSMEKKDLNQQNSELKQQNIKLLFANQFLQHELNAMKEKYKLLEEKLALNNQIKSEQFFNLFSNFMNTSLVLKV